MKKLLFSLLLALAGSMLMAGEASAKIIRVNTLGLTPNSTTIFANLQAAHDAATTVSGDIIYIETGPVSAGNLTCIKPNLTIIGNGYFAENASLRYNTMESLVGRMDFNATGCRITGCASVDEGGGVYGGIFISANNTVVERNYIQGGVHLKPTGGNLSNVLIRANYVTSGGSWGSGIYFDYGSSSAYQVVGAIVSNNIVKNDVSASTDWGAMRMAGCTIENNVIEGNLNVDNALIIKNNILTSTSATSFTARNNAFRNNIGADAQFVNSGTNISNQQNVNMATVFVVHPTRTIDAHYVLVAGTSNPAYRTGYNSADCGVFGSNSGSTYVLSGIADVPTIYQFSHSLSGNTLNAVMSTRSNK